MYQSENIYLSLHLRHIAWFQLEVVNIFQKIAIWEGPANIVIYFHVG